MHEGLKKTIRKSANSTINRHNISPEAIDSFLEHVEKSDIYPDVIKAINEELEDEFKITDTYEEYLNLASIDKIGIFMFQAIIAEQVDHFPLYTILIMKLKGVI